MDAEILFLRTLHEVRKRIDLADPYISLELSGYLRKLLMDKVPLAVDANREYSLKFIFRVHAGKSIAEKCAASGIALDHIAYQMTLDAFDPEGWPDDEPVRDLHLTQFLGEEVGAVRSKLLTVRDVISQLAHVEGGVHKGQARSDEEKAMADFEQRMRIEDAGPVTTQIHAIAKVALRALEPLEAAIKAKRGFV